MSKCQANCKKVYVYHKDGTYFTEFESEKETAEKLFYNRNFIYLCLNGKANCRNYIFRFEKIKDGGANEKRNN